MPLFLVERDFAESTFDPTDAQVGAAAAYELGNEITWLTSFLSADRKKTYCLYEVEDPAVLQQHARDLGLPVDTIVEVTELMRP